MSEPNSNEHDDAADATVAMLDDAQAEHDTADDTADDAEQAEQAERERIPWTKGTDTISVTITHDGKPTTGTMTEWHRTKDGKRERIYLLPNTTPTSTKPKRTDFVTKLQALQVGNTEAVEYVEGPTWTPGGTGKQPKHIGRRVQAEATGTSAQGVNVTVTSRAVRRMAADGTKLADTATTGAWSYSTRGRVLSGSGAGRPAQVPDDDVM